MMKDRGDYNRTETRLQLLKNGYEPLANHHKMCLFKGWSQFDITEEMIRSKDWARNGRGRDTGVRCGRVVALDMDILDADLLEDLADAVIENGIIEESFFVRVGKAPKELWVYRTEETIGRGRTGKFGVEGELDGHQVEVLGKGCQFAAYGEHSPGVPYQWIENNLLDYEWSELPVISKGQTTELIEFATEFFEARGFVRLSVGADMADGFALRYDLEKDHVYLTDELGEVDVETLQAYLSRQAPGTSIRLRSSPFRPGEHDLKSVVASISHGEICISDFLLGTSQFLSDHEMHDCITDIGKALTPFIEHQEEQQREQRDKAVEDLVIYPGDPFDLALEKCLKRFVYLPSLNEVGDIMKRGDANWTITMDAFRNRLYPFFKEMPKNKTTVVERLDHTWKQMPERMIAEDAMMRPDMPAPFFTDERGLDFVNTYKRPSFPEGGTSLPGHDMLRRLVPDQRERRWLKQWLAKKWLEPATRGHGVIMVAPDAYGTGRGTFLKMLSKIFGENLVASIDFNTFAGKTYQSQYNDWVADNLIVAIEEAQETSPGETRWQLRTNAYEHLKNIVDPGKQSTWVSRKVNKNSPSRIFSSIIIFTNHVDAIAIPPNDRRLTVLANGPAQPPDYWANIHAWIDDAANIGAFVRDLERVDLSDYNPYGAPLDTSMRRRMIDISASDLDILVDEAFASFEGDVAVFEQMRRYIEHAIQVYDDADLPDGWKKIARKTFDRRTSPTNLRIKLGGSRRLRPRIIKNTGVWADAEEEAVLKEVLRNGDPYLAHRDGDIIDLQAHVKSQKDLK